MNEIPKVVFSDSLASADWSETTIAAGDLAEAITRLKQERSDGYLLAHGGVRFARSLVKTDVIDEYRLMIHPVVLGAGERIFDAPLSGRVSYSVRATGGANAVTESARRSGQSVSMADAGPFEPEKAHWYTDDDRRDQLRRLRDACRELAKLSDLHQSGHAGSYLRTAEAAEALLAKSHDQADLSAVGRSLQPPPTWMQPKDADYDGPWQAWQYAVANARHDADRAALELRSLAEYDAT
jgi:hypothetical protein